MVLLHLSDGEQHNPTILHTSPTGSIERVLCAMLEKTAIELNEKWLKELMGLSLKNISLSILKNNKVL